MNKVLTLRGVALALCFAPETALAQCALCRDAVGAAAPHIREAMNYAIIGLAFAPYIVAFLAAWTLSPAFRTSIRSRFGRSALSKTEPRS